MKKRTNRLVFRRYPQDHLQRLYRFLNSYQETHGFMPSTREVAIKYKTHHSTVRYWYGLMTEAGMLRIHPGIARAVVLLPLETKKEPV